MSPLDSRPTFASEARAVLDRVRRASADLLTAVGAVQRPVDVQTALGLDKKLAWRLHRLATATDPLRAAPFVPSTTSLRKVDRAAARLGVEKAVRDALRDAAGAFDALVGERAADRSSFDAMAAAASGAGLDTLQSEARRAAHRANVIVHGRQSDVLVYAFLVGPGAKPGTVDGISLRGHIGLQRLRATAPVELARHRFDLGGESLPAAQPLDPEGAERCGAPVVAAFSSPDLPDLIQEDADGGFRRTTLTNADVGATSALDFLLADRNPAIPLVDALGSLCEVQTPTKALVADLLLHEDVPVETPDLRVVASRAATDEWPAPDAPEVLPVESRLEDLGPALATPDLSPWSRQGALFRWAIERAGWDPARLRHHRAVIDHPPLFSVTWLRAPAAS